MINKCWVFPAIASLNLWLAISLKSMTSFIFNPATSPPFSHTFSINSRSQEALAVPKLSWSQIRDNLSHCRCCVGENSKGIYVHRKSLPLRQEEKKQEVFGLGHLGRTRATILTNLRLGNYFFDFCMKYIHPLYLKENAKKLWQIRHIENCKVKFLSPSRGNLDAYTVIELSMYKNCKVKFLFPSRDNLGSIHCYRIVKTSNTIKPLILIQCPIW